MAACSPPAGGVVECTDGELAGGVPNPPAGTTTLNVHGLDADIAPAVNVPGIQFITVGPGGDDGTVLDAAEPGLPGPPVTIKFTDSNRTITTTGANGIIGQSTGGLGGAGQAIGRDGRNGGSGGAVVIDNQGIVRTAGTAAIFAASVGGGGGNGGNSGLANAGDAGSGGGGGPATINNAGEVQTTGDNAAGLLAVSRGGNGAIGGDQVGAGDAGTGGGGGAAGTVTVDNDANVSTAGAGSAAILARSLGGNGGNGGDGYVIIVGSGGGGGATGNGGTVNVTSNGALKTTGPANAVGILAQSVGGFAGAAGDVIGLVGFAGDGNSGGFGGRVEVRTEGGSITTSGSASHGILAQSIGGGGGAGGTGAGVVGFGGNGGPGGDGGEVEVHNNAAISTTGNGSGGVIAQSVGGGGGSGGTGAGLAAIGGGGGGGGNGSNVTVGNTNTIKVSGDGAGYEFGNYGIFAQSVGGQGGSANASGGIVAIGGSGGPGGNSGTVEVTNSSNITSSCSNCRDAGAIYAQSVGGGGGRGGNSGGLFAIGGSGGGGGLSGAVTVTNSGVLETHGMLSRGIFAQSIGGGGGDGGFAGGVFTGGGGGGEGGSAANPLRIGGKGTDDTRANQTGEGVTVNNSGNITTTGDESQGIFAQSVGGGGGNGGGSVAVGAFIAIAVGGTGGIGGDGGIVTVNNVSQGGAPGPVIETGGERSAGIFAQSVGGGGGSGGFAVAASGGIFAGLSAAFGGDGAEGGDGGAVEVNSNGEIKTLKSFSSGIYAESIGGGGGRGGFAVAAGVSVSGVQATLNFGGGGGAGGTADNVTVDNSSKITTGCEGCVSDESHGIFASSIGGGGGSGGFSIGAGVGTYAAASLSFGGNAGAGNNSGAVEVDNDGEITTYGRQSHGILAQSIGGGGGSGGFSGSLSFSLSAGGAMALAFGGDGGEGGAGNTVTIDNRANISTFGDGSNGIFAQSIGGGGGNGGFAGAISFTVQGVGSFANSVGGNAGTGSTGKNVTVTHTGEIATRGNNATGILAQSVGGGGGNGGFSLAGSGTINGDATAQSVGGKGGQGGTSGVVKVGTSDNFIAGSIETSGAQSHGIQAQSIAGGGGNGGFSVSAGFTLTGNSKAGSVGGNGGGGQHASQFIEIDGEQVEIASVEVHSNARIVTGANCAADGTGCRASGSHGIFAQSVGGGGGAGGFSIAGNFSLEGNAKVSNVGGTGLGGGDGGMVVVESGGEITTRGPSSHGIFAQSVGGGGGSGAFSIAGSVTLKGDAKTQNVGGSGGAAGHGGEVTVTVRNNITTVGALSHGVFAQSVGGGGGDGGFSLGAGFSLEGDAGTSSIGGDGGGGGDGKKVTVNVGSAATPLFPTIHTTKNGSIGVFAQSVGGGGGSGGFAGGLSLAINGKAENKVGGDGGATGGRGGSGGEVQVSNWGSIKTEGDNAAGILAQSVGGSGGNGGFSISGTLGNSSAVSDSVGGAAGGGGHSSKVQVDNFGSIETGGNFSHGIIAQSIGCSGGNGGFSVGLDVNISGSQGSSASKVGGGAGGAGGAGGEVVVNNTGTITVNGDNAFGVFAQSVGGGGGSGGIAGGLAIGGSVESAVGGQGGQGGNGGDVTVISTGSISVTGNNSSAVFAQSVAGSGGWSGLAIGLGTNSNTDGIKLGLGSKSIKECLSIDGIKECLPSGGQQGKVTVTIDGETTVTDGALSYGLLAQAIAGGGGAVGTVLEGVLNFTGSDVVLEVGSDNAVVDDAAHVFVSYGNDSTQKGIASIGLIAQSIGGGGGVTGLVMDTANLNPNGVDEFRIRVGGISSDPANNGGGSGGGFDFTAKGTVTTLERNAIGILAQTIGGGGGIGNVSVNTVVNDSNALRIVLGGAQLTEGNAGPASTVTAEQKITTSGILSHGMLAQSIGGGGGVANVVFQNGVTLTTGVAITLGGAGGAGGDGGDLTAAASDVATTGVGAMGMVAQSIGGGGGLTGVASNGVIFGQEGFALASVAGGSGAIGDGGVVTVDAHGAVHTTGFGAHGIVAQSIGGGGGIAGGGLFRTTLGGPGAFAGSIGGEGGGKGVTVTTLKNVVVTGENSIGIFGQSAGVDGQGDVEIKVDKSGNGVGLIWASAGTGAAVQFADGAGNSLETNGTLYAQGSLAGSGLPANIGGLAILGGSGAETTINLAYAMPAAPLPPSLFGFGADYGVVFDMTTGALDPVTGLPVFDAGTRTSNIIGNVDAGGGNNRFINEAGALFITELFVKLDDDATPVALGAGQELANAGLLSPGDRGKVQVTDVSGNFTQSLTGTYFIDIDLNQQNSGSPVTDRLNVTGGSAVGGEGGLLLLSIDKAFTEYVIVSSEAGTSDDGFIPKLTPPAIGFNFDVKLGNGGKDLVLFADKPPFNDLLKDPASGTRDPNVWRIGKGLDNIEKAISVDDSFNYLINLLRLQPDAKALGDAVVTLTPSQAPHLFEATFRQNMGFLDQIIECPRDFGQALFVGRRNCLWMEASYAEYDRESVDDSPTNKDKWNAFSVGGHTAVDENWQLGFGLQRSEIDSNQYRDGAVLSRLDGEVYQLGVSATYRDGGFGLGLVAAGSFGDWNANRFVNVNGFSQNFTDFIGIAANAGGVELPIFADNEIVFDGVSGTARSNPEVSSFNPRLRLSYTESYGSADVMPFLDIDAYILHTDYREEDGVGLANLEYPARTETTVTFTPGVELGGTTQATDYTAVRGFLRASVMLAIDDSWTAKTQFAAAPPGVPDIEITDKFDDVLGKIDAGIMVFGPGGELRVNYSGAFGETTEQHEVSGEFAYRF